MGFGEIGKCEQSVQEGGARCEARAVTICTACGKRLCKDHLNKTPRGAFCPDCVGTVAAEARARPKTAGKCEALVGIFQVRPCGKPAKDECAVCGRLICAEHTVFEQGNKVCPECAAELEWESDVPTYVGRSRWRRSYGYYRYRGPYYYGDDYYVFHEHHYHHHDGHGEEHDEYDASES